MGPLATGFIVLVRFPFSDLSQARWRPAVLLAAAGREDWVICQVTSNPYRGSRTIPLTDACFATGSLRLASYVRPDKLFTVHQNLIVRQLGVLQTDVFSEIVEAVIDVLRASQTS